MTWKKHKHLKGSLLILKKCSLLKLAYCDDFHSERNLYKQGIYMYLYMCLCVCVYIANSVSVLYLCVA